MNASDAHTNTQLLVADALFLRAARGEDTRTAPVWLMRQAGRHLPEYLRLKERYSFWQLVRTPELAAQVTLQPVERYALDAAILFSDIMTPLPAMGMAIDFKPGPVFVEPIRSEAHVAALRIPDEQEIAPFVADTLNILRARSPVPVIGFAGSPLTLATYAIEGSASKDYSTFRAFLRQEPVAAHALLEKLTEVTIRYLKVQVQSGAQAIQLFDSWAGLHDRNFFREFAVPYVQRVLESLAPYGVPRIYFAVDSIHLAGEIRELSAEVVGVDWRWPLSKWREAVPEKVLQGNLDPSQLLGPPSQLVVGSERVLHEGLGGAHIFNLGHGILPTTGIDAVSLLVDTVRAFDRTRSSESLGADKE